MTSGNIDFSDIMRSIQAKMNSIGNKPIDYDTVPTGFRSMKKNGDIYTISPWISINVEGYVKGRETFKIDTVKILLQLTWIGSSVHAKLILPPGMPPHPQIGMSGNPCMQNLDNTNYQSMLDSCKQVLKLYNYDSPMHTEGIRIMTEKEPLGKIERNDTWTV